MKITMLIDVELTTEKGGNYVTTCAICSETLHPESLRWRLAPRRNGVASMHICGACLEELASKADEG